MTILVGTGSGLHRAEDGHTELADRAITALAGDFALVDGKAVWRDGDWVGEVAGEPGANCLLPVDGSVLVGTAEAHLLRLPGGERVPGFEEVPERQRWYTPWGGPPDVRSISRDDDGIVYANVHVGGIVRSTDDGVSWEPTLDIHADVHQVLAPPSHPGLVLAACAKGLARSVDGGDAWAFETDGLHAAYCRAVTVGDGTLYLSASRSHRGDRACLYRRPLDGGPFEKCIDGLPEWFPDNIDTFCVAAAGSRVAFGTNDGSVFLSEDAGRTWAAWAVDLPPVRCVAFA